MTPPRASVAAPTSVAVDLGRYLRVRHSPLAHYVNEITEAGNRYRIDPRLIVAVAGGETSFATAGGGPKVYNAWGIGPGRAYASWAEGIDAAAKLLRESYVGQGLTSLEKIQRKWAPVGAGNDPRNLNSNWLRTIGGFYSGMGGDPNDVTKGWRQAASPRAPERTRKLLGLPTLGGATEPAEVTNPLGESALQTMLGIARGEDANKGFQQLLQLTVERAKVDAAALQSRDQPPAAEVTGLPKRSPDGGSYTHVRTEEKTDLPGRQKAVDLAVRQVGKPYVWGGTSPTTGFDCSGLIEWAYERAGIPTPGRLTTYSMRKVGRKVRGALEPGDWIITNRGRHVVMYVGGGQVVAAPRRGTNVQLQSLDRFQGQIVDIRRYP